MACELSVGAMAVGEMSVGEMAVGEMAVDELAVGECLNYRFINLIYCISLYPEFQ